MNTALQKRVLSKKVSSDVDLEAEIDDTLTLPENETNLKAKGMIAQDISDNEAERNDWIESKAYELLRSLKPSKRLDKHYYHLKKYVEIVAKSQQIHSLFLIGKHGLGKTWNTIKTLVDLEMPFIHRSGKITPKALYKILYDNRTSIFFFDDTLSIIRDADCLTILFEALWSPTGVRTIHWNSTRKVANLPNEFIFEGKIIFCMNELPKNEMMDTLISRCFAYELTLSYDEIIDIMEAIAKQKGSLKPKQRREVLDFIKQYTDQSTEEFDLRLQKKGEILRAEVKDWKKIMFPQLSKDKTKWLAFELSEKEFMEKTGKSRATYYRKRRD